jgi:hypothetical protein
MADDDQIIVEIAPDEDAGKTEQKRGADGQFVAREPSDELASQFAELQEQSKRDAQALLTERNRRQQAEREVARASEELTTARGEVIESQVSTVESGLAAAQAEADAAEREYTAAFEAGDGARMGQAQRKIAKAEARIARLDEAKADLETRKTKPAIEADPRRTEAPQRRLEAIDDPVEAYVSGRSEKTAKWLRAHPDFVTDQRKNAKLTAAHWDATGEGIEADTPEYFAHVESYIGLKPNGQNGQATPAPKPRRSTVPAAPVNGSGTSAGSGGTEVILSRGEAQAAEDGTHIWNYDDPSPAKKFRKGDPIGKQEFARRKLALTKQGAYDRSYVES